jgi:hypothetical protein
MRIVAAAISATNIKPKKTSRGNKQLDKKERLE